MKVDARFPLDSYVHSKSTETHLVLSLTAPAVDWQAKRAPVFVLPVIDVSPSMEGNKIEYAKKSAIKLIDNLKPGDYCGLVTFSGTAETIFVPQEMTQSKKDALKAKVGELRLVSATNLGAGMLEAFQHANRKDLPENMIRRIIVLTDGDANTGVTGRDALLKLLQANIGTATMSAFGYGSDAKQETLADLAKAGNGNYAFIRNAEDALSAFAKELGGLLSVYAQNLCVELWPHQGHKLLEVVSDVESTDEKDHLRIKFPELMGEETRHLVLKVQLTEQSQALPRPLNVADLKLTYDRLDEQMHKSTETVEQKIKVQFAKTVEATVLPNAEVMEIIGLAEMVRAQIEAEELAKTGNYAGASSRMGVTRSFFENNGLHKFGTLADSFAMKMNSSAAYAANSVYLASSKSVLTRNMGTSAADANVLADFSGTSQIIAGTFQNSAQESNPLSFPTLHRLPAYDHSSHHHHRT